MRRRILIQKSDMDTCLCGLILGISRNDEVVGIQGEAGKEDLENRDIVCIEAGGSGQVGLNNFDHHNTAEDLPPACRQAFELKGGNNALERLVEYVATVDVDPTSLPRADFLTLSNVFSGMLLSVKDRREKFFCGMDIFQRVLGLDLDPFGKMPELLEWKTWIEVKKREKERLSEVVKKAEFFESRSGLKIGFVETDVIGAPGKLYGLGCDLAIVYCPNFGTPPIRKFTIAGNNSRRVDHLLPVLNELEPGWGGPAHGTIIGSPREGSLLSSEDIIKLVSKRL
ncbi:hypothetical protein KJ693_07665 [bacterium]|nr:hypothetical protein [bacterium]MBU1615175.1 hypothetical protein [bacterium]